MTDNFQIWIEVALAVVVISLVTRNVLMPSGKKLRTFLLDTAKIAGVSAGAFMALQIGLLQHNSLSHNEALAMLTHFRNDIVMHQGVMEGYDLKVAGGHLDDKQEFLEAAFDFGDEAIHDELPIGFISTEASAEIERYHEEIPHHHASAFEALLEHDLDKPSTHKNYKDAMAGYVDGLDGFIAALDQAIGEKG